MIVSLLLYMRNADRPRRSAVLKNLCEADRAKPAESSEQVLNYRRLDVPDLDLSARSQLASMRTASGTKEPSSATRK